MNFLVAKLAADYVPAVFSGEGSDELFAGYSYLKDLPLE
jgi:asparagine synthetase B (glutamine-hydrolysing)